MDNINNGSKLKKKNSFNFSQKKENTICSLHEVESFLCNFQKALKFYKIFCIFK